MEAVYNGNLDIEKVQTFLIGLGAGGAIGVITGAAIKHTAKRIAIILGTVFIFLQVAQYIGFVEVRWDKVTESALPLFDKNEDGKLTEEDAVRIFDTISIMAPEILAKGLPNLAGFASGMLLAFWFL